MTPDKVPSKGRSKRKANNIWKNSNIPSSRYTGNDRNVDIQLDTRNFVRGTLHDGKGISLLFDSGATRSIISSSTVQNSKYLSSIQPVSVDVVNLKLGNGQFIHAYSTITFQVKIQGHEFQLSALIAANLTGIDLILGSQTLKELNGSLDFTTNCFRIKQAKVFLRPVQRFVIYPGQQRYITVQGRLPLYARNADVVIKPFPLISRMCPSRMLVKMHKGRTKILLRNMGNQKFCLHPSRTVAHLDLADIITVTEDIPTDSLDFLNVMTHERHRKTVSF